ncbi:hypothetical protein CPB86DRAFT_379229 [Serendipita vermifera]|nr:hypothetical protein CPB86DRAFT_379229 [Serendipita vermifera]
MAFHYPHHNALTSYTSNGPHGHWNDYETMPQTHSNDAASNLGVFYAHTQPSIGIVTFNTLPSSFSLPHPPAGSLHPSCDPPPNPIFQSVQSIPVDSGHYTPSIGVNVFGPQPRVEPTPSSSAPVAANIPTINATPIVTPAATPYSRAKFACPSCGKMFTSRPRAFTCILNHMGAKPFACHGTRGLVGCTKRYASEAPLKRHCASFEERFVLCSNCGQPRSKQNFARHQRKCN